MIEPEKQMRKLARYLHAIFCHECHKELNLKLSKATSPCQWTEEYDLKEEKEMWDKKTHQEWMKEAEMLYNFLKEIDII